MSDQARSEQSPFLKRWATYDAAREAFLNKLFMANAAGSVAVLSFIGAQVSRGSSPVGVIVLIAFLSGVICATVAIWSIVESKFIRAMETLQIEKRVSRERFLDKSEREKQNEIDLREEFLDEATKSLFEERRFLDNDGGRLGLKISKKITNLLADGIVESISGSASFFCFIVGCMIGLVMLATI